MKKNKEVKLDHMVIDDRADLLYKDEPPAELSEELKQSFAEIFKEFEAKRKQIT